ncbi:predicted protein [Botrytis cinerea T4]|uniref:Uncharacterized protein n=1 Tax=Botryotinia fuckeliana (strain T4) TaxID=999810 RepID=G2YM78_BOTF4|nr:predicted protein [Botrytis cinerea T4]
MQFLETVRPFRYDIDGVALASSNKLKLSKQEAVPELEYYQGQETPTVNPSIPHGRDVQTAIAGAKPTT